MPSLQSISDSDDSEDDQFPRQWSTTEQCTIPPSVLHWVNDLSNQLFPRSPLQQPQQHADQSSSLLNQPASDETGTGLCGSLQSAPLSNAGQGVGDPTDEPRGQGAGRTNEMSTEGHPHINFGHRISGSHTQARNQDEGALDGSRANVVIGGLESVLEDPLCYACSGRLDQDPPSDTEDHRTWESILETKMLLRALPCYPAFPGLVTLPCLHIFHLECISWSFKWVATCPSCGFDLDPDSLTLHDGSAERPWIQALEEGKGSCLRPDDSVGVESELRGSSLTQASDNLVAHAGSVGTFHTCDRCSRPRL